MAPPDDSDDVYPNYVMCGLSELAMVRPDLRALPSPFKTFLLKEALLADPQQLYFNAIQASEPDWNEHAAAEVLRIAGPWGVLRPPGCAFCSAETDGALLCDNDVYLHVLEPFASAWDLNEPISWDDITRRLRDLIPEIQAILDDNDTARSRPSLERLYSFDFYQTASPGLKLLPSVARYSQQLKGTAQSITYTGYYGARGMRVLRQFLVATFTDAADLQDENTSSIYVSHLAIRLVMEDMKWEGDLGMVKAWLLILETQQFGVARDARTPEDPPEFLAAMASLTVGTSNSETSRLGTLGQDGHGEDADEPPQLRKSTRRKRPPQHLIDSSDEEEEPLAKKGKGAKRTTKSRVTRRK